jgi:hypothetical protein
MAKQELDRTRMMQDTEMQRAQTMFEQAQAGWMQDPETGQWTNLNELEAEERAAMQDQISLMSVNATQRAEVLGEMQYWQAVLADSSQAMLHADAQRNLGTLQTRYANLLLNNATITGAPQAGTTPETETPAPETTPENTVTTEDGTVVPRVTPEDGGVKVETGLNLTSSMDSYVADKLIGLGITEETELPNFNNRIRNAEDLAPFIRNLAGDKATEGYDFAPEFELVNRYLKTPTEISKAEYNKLQAAGIIKNNVDYYEAAHNIEIGTGGNYAKLSTDNPANAQFVEQLINTGYIDREFAKVDTKDNEYQFSIVDLQRKANNYNLTWGDLYDQFLSGSLRGPNSATMSATQSAGYSSFDPRMLE